MLRGNRLRRMCRRARRRIARDAIRPPPTDVTKSMFDLIATLVTRRGWLILLGWIGLTALLVKVAPSWDEVSRDDDVRCVVVTGNGRAFSAGDDIVGGMGERPGNPPMAGGQPIQMTREMGPHFHMTKTLMSMPKPVVAIA